MILFLLAYLAYTCLYLLKSPLLSGGWKEGATFSIETIKLDKKVRNTVRASSENIAASMNDFEHTQKSAK